MKKKQGKIFIRGFMRSFLYLSTFLIVFLISYKITGIYLEQKNTEDLKSSSINMQLAGSVDPVAFNLIYDVEESSEELQHVILEILNTNTNDLVYMTIPVNTKLTMSSELYKSICEKNANVPQILSFSNFSKYINPKNYYDFGTTLIEDALDIDISYYTIITSDMFTDIFTETDGYVMLSDSITDVVSKYSEPNIVTYLTDFYNCTKCNLSLKDRLMYTAALSKVKLDGIMYAVLPGETDGYDYIADLSKISEIVYAVQQNYVSDEIESLLGAVEQVSLGKNITVLNGSGITGLASKVQEQLKAEGYTVTSIANYSSSDVSNTIIRVNEDGLGADLVSYFHSASIEMVQDMPYGVDIQIILGKSESLS